MPACVTHIVKSTKKHTTKIVIQMMTVMTNVICLIYVGTQEVHSGHFLSRHCDLYYLALNVMYCKLSH